MILSWRSVETAASGRVYAVVSLHGFRFLSLTPSVRLLFKTLQAARKISLLVPRPESPAPAGRGRRCVQMAIHSLLQVHYGNGQAERQVQSAGCFNAGIEVRPLVILVMEEMALPGIGSSVLRRDTAPYCITAVKKMVDFDE